MSHGDYIPLPERVDRERDRQRAIGFDWEHDARHSDRQWDEIMRPYRERIMSCEIDPMEPELLEYNLVALMALAAARAEARILERFGIHPSEDRIRSVGGRRIDAELD